MLRTKLTMLCLAAAVCGPALAHPGHDHAGAPGGQWHHLLWLATGAVALLCGAVLRRRVSRDGSNDR